MATERIDIIIQDRIDPGIENRIRRIGQGARDAGEGLNDLDRQLRELGRGTRNIQDTGFRQLLGTLTKLVGGAYGLKLADEYNVLQNKLRLVTRSEAELNVVTNELFDIANRSRSPVLELTASFKRFDGALKPLGASQRETLRLTETIGKALVLSGANTGEQAAALLQLSQAFNKGKLDGDEFRTTMELIPIAGNAIAKNLGVLKGELLDLAPKGKITAQVMREAFASIADEVDKGINSQILTLDSGFTILRNNIIQTFGEINKQLGITEAFSNVLVTLGENMRAVAVFAAFIGTSISSAFGPTLLRALGFVGRFFANFFIALATNPLRLFSVSLQTAIIFLSAFQNEIKVTADGIVTLGDRIRATFQVIEEIIKPATDQFALYWKEFTDSVAKNNKDMENNIGIVMGVIGAQIRSDVNNIIATWKISSFSIIKIWNNLGIVLIDISKKTTNAIAGVLESAFDIDLSIVKTETSGIFTEIEKEAEKVFGMDYTKEFIDRIKVAEREIAKVRIAGENLRGEGEAEKSSKKEIEGGKGGKVTKSRAEVLAELNRELDSEIRLLNLVGRGTEALSRFEEIHNQLLEKKIILDEKEKLGILNKLATIENEKRIQEASQEIYDEFVDVKFRFNDVTEAANRLLAAGTITEAEHLRVLIRTKEEYENSKDPMRQYNKNLKDQFDLAKLLPSQLEVETELLRLKNEAIARGLPLSNQYLANLKEELNLLRQKQAIQQQKEQILDSTVGGRKDFEDQVQAISELLDDSSSRFGETDAFKFLTENTDVGQYLEQSQQTLDAQMIQFETFYAQIDLLEQKRLINSKTAEQARTRIQLDSQQVQLQAANQFFSALSGLQNSNIRELAIIGRAAAIAQAIINTYVGATKALAQGGIFGAALAAAVVASGLVYVAQIIATPLPASGGGFQQGGFTGSGARDEVAGTVHGQEFVFDATATRRLGVSNLEALRVGAAGVQQNIPTGVQSVGSDSSGPNGVGQRTGQNQSMPKIYNILDPGIVGDFLSSSDSDSVFINKIRRNAEAIRPLVA